MATWATTYGLCHWGRPAKPGGSGIVRPYCAAERRAGGSLGSSPPHEPITEASAGQPYRCALRAPVVPVNGRATGTRRKTALLTDPWVISGGRVGGPAGVLP